jgi:hypothetical protein
LATLARQFDPKVASRICTPLIDRLLSAPNTEKEEADRAYLVQGGMRLIQALDPESASVYSLKLARSICSGDMGIHLHENYSYFTIDEILTDSSQVTVNSRVSATAMAASLTISMPLTALPVLAVASEPFPCRLSTQDLVDLLKMPTCFGEERRIILKHLGNRYHRRFANHWEFVRYAQEHHLDLDFTTPPKRPART